MSNVKKRKCIQIFLLGLRHCTDFKDRGGDTAQKDCGQMFKLRWGHRTEFKDRGGDTAQKDRTDEKDRGDTAQVLRVAGWLGGLSEQ